MIYSNKKIIQSLGEILKIKGITHIVMSPGSRNAPLIIHFNQKKIFTTYSIVDERSAAFFALGISQAIKNAVVILCTSGSAIANYYPAITEAYYQYIPLIIITADRPKEYIDIFEGQTIRQENFFQNHTVKSVQLTENINQKGLLYNERLINEAINEALIKRQPIHINIPLSEPLDEITNKLIVAPKIIDIPKIIPILHQHNINKYKKLWLSNKKKMILIGQCNLNDRTQKLLNKINEDPSIIILTETLSNIYNKKFILYIDRVLIPMTLEEWKTFIPDILLTIGKNIISKKLKFLFRSSKIKYHWHIDSIKRIIPDTYQKLTSYIITYPEVFLKYLIIKQPIHSDYKIKWLNINLYRNQKHNIYIKNIQFSDMQVLDFILKKIPNNYILQLGNSTIIRYQQYLDRNPNIKSYSNRGTAGIDGSLSTAVGFATVSTVPVIVLIGDISFFYDSNALWNNYIPSNFRIILINNGGGNIFKMLYKNPKLLKRYFEHEHNLTAKYICQTYNINYLQINNMQKLKSYINNFWNNSKKAKLLEISTKFCNNELILNKYFQSLI